MTKIILTLNGGHDFCCDLLGATLVQVIGVTHIAVIEPIIIIEVEDRMMPDVQII